MKILILGHNGMLGHMVKMYLEKYFTINTIEDRWPSKEFKRKIESSDANYIINCIGSIPQKTKDFDINYILPIWLDINFNGKVIHPGTDCEIDTDAYGISKKKAKDYIINESKKTKILKASIIGPELNSKSSLLEWFLNSSKEVKGYTNSMWSGITTLEWSKHCLDLIRNWDSYELENIIESTCLSKYDLLHLIKDVYNKDIDIIADPTVVTKKCLLGNIKALDIKTQLIELKNYYNHDTD